MSPMTSGLRKPLAGLPPYARWALIIAAHGVLVGIAYLLAFLLRYDFELSVRKWHLLGSSLLLLLAVRLVGFSMLGVYRGLWRYASIQDIVGILRATTLTGVVFTTLATFLFPKQIPRSIFLLDWTFCVGLVAGARLLAIMLRTPGSFRRRRRFGARRVLIVGAGDPAERLLRELERDHTAGFEAVGLLDDDRSQRGVSIRGIPILGAIRDLPRVADETDADEVVVAKDPLAASHLRDIVALAQKAGLPVRRVPGLTDLMSGTMKAAQLQEIQPEDLLDREPARVDVPRIKEELAGRRVLITGAAGSIGSELAWQIAGLDPAELVLLDRAESNLYFLSVRLRERSPDLLITPAVGDILNAPRLRELLRDHRPDVVYHAAAYKHVPLMEENALEAIENNALGTELVAHEAARAGVGKLILVSTDKAVEPVGIMGMTKRAAELVVLSLLNEATQCVVVRFGNVLGSDGSVLPLFKWQAATSGQLTVTDPDVSRYFMLPSEAVQLVLEAGRMGRQGDIFFLNMGEPIRIMDLANRLVRKSGFEPGIDVDIAITGLRPGERLTEVLLGVGEELGPTDHKWIYRIHHPPIDRTAFVRDLDILRQAVADRDRATAVDRLKRIATTY